MRSPWSTRAVGVISDWGNSCSLPVPTSRTTGAFFDTFVSWAAESVPKFLADLGDRMPPIARAIYARISAAAPRDWSGARRVGARLHLRMAMSTLATSCIHASQEAGPALIIDWKRAGVTFGASDLAYMMALYWFPPLRRQREQGILRAYHERLLAYGVTGYAWADFGTTTVWLSCGSSSRQSGAGPP